MVNKPKVKGTLAESAVVSYLASYGLPVERRALSGALDKGDIAGVDGWVIEVKAHDKPRYAEWLREAEIERRNAGADYAAVIHKPRGIALPEKYIVCLSMRTFVGFL